MYEFRTTVRPGHEAERVSTAFYRFLELHSSSAMDGARMRTEIYGESEVRVFQFWSDDVVASFERYLVNFRVDPPGGLPRPFGLDEWSSVRRSA